MTSSPALISEKNLSIISMMLDGIERDMEHSKHLVQVKNLKHDNFEETINYLTRDNLILMDLLKEAEERFEINLQETSATITDLKKYYEEKLQTGEGELERIIEQCNTAQRERDNLARLLLTAEESCKDINRKYLVSEKNNKSQIIVIEELKEQNLKQDEKMKQLSDYCAMLEQSHAEMNAYQKDKAASVKQTMRSEVDRYYQQVAQLQIRVHELEMENALLKSSQFGREGRSSSSSTARPVHRDSSSEDSLTAGKSPRTAQQIFDRPLLAERDHDSHLLFSSSSSSSSRSSDRQRTVKSAEQQVSASPSPVGYDSRGQEDSDVDAAEEGDYENQQIYFASSGDKFSEDSMNNWDLNAGLSAWNRSEESAAHHTVAAAAATSTAAHSLDPWDTATDRDMQQPLEMMDPDDIYDPNRLGLLSPADDSKVTKMVQLYRQLLGDTDDSENGRPNLMPDNLHKTDFASVQHHDRVGEEKEQWASNRVERRETDGDRDQWAGRARGGELGSGTDQSNMLLWLASGGGGGGRGGVDVDDDDYYNPMEDEEDDGGVESGGGADMNLQDLSRLDSAL